MTESTIPLPKARTTIRLTQAGGWNRRCSKCPGGGWAMEPRSGTCIFQPHGDGVECGEPYTEANWTQCKPKTRTGRVAKIETGMTGLPLLTFRVPDERSEYVAWDHHILSCEVVK